MCLKKANDLYEINPGFDYQLFALIKTELAL